MANSQQSIEEFLSKLPKDLAEKIRKSRLNTRVGNTNFNYNSVQDLIKDLPATLKSELGDYLYERKGLNLDLTPVIQRQSNKEIFDENRKIPKDKIRKNDIELNQELVR